MRPCAPTLAAALALAGAAAPACGGGGSPFEQAEGEYQRFVEGNDLDEANVARMAAKIAERLEEEPLVSRTDRDLGPPDGSQPEGALAEELRLDLLGGGSTAAARAISVIRGLELRRHVPDLLALVRAHRLIPADGTVLGEASPALRTVVIKRLALDAARALAEPPR